MILHAIRNELLITSLIVAFIIVQVNQAYAQAKYFDPTIPAYVGDIVSYQYKGTQGKGGTWTVNSEIVSVLEESEDKLKVEVISAGGFFLSHWNSADGVKQVFIQTYSVPPPAPPDSPPSLTPDTPIVAETQCGWTTIQMPSDPPFGTELYWQTHPNGQSTGRGKAYQIKVYSNGTYYLQARSTSYPYAWGPISGGLAVSVNAVPSNPLSKTFPVCEAGPITLTTTTESNSLRWYDAAAPTKVLYTGLDYPIPWLDGQATYLVASFNTSTSCESSERAIVTVTFEHPSTPELNIGTNTICVGTELNISTTGSGTPYYWIYRNDGNTTTNEEDNSMLGDSFSYTFNGVGSWVIKVITRSSIGCESPQTERTLSVVDLPALVSPLFALPICSGTKFSYVPASNVAGASFKWTRAAITGISEGASSGNGAVNETLTNTTSASIDVVYKYVTTGTCSGSPQDVVVRVKPLPSITNLPATVPYCANTASGAVLNFTPASTISGTTYTWTNSVTGSISGATPASGSGTGVINPTVYNTGSTAGAVVYTFTPSYAGCTGPAKTYTATIHPKPSIGGISNQSICSAQTVSFLLTSQVGGTTYSWTQVPTNVAGSSNGSGPFINQTLSNTNGLNNGAVVYTVVGTAGTCTGTTSATVTVKPLPAFAPVPPTASIWSGGTASYSPVFTISSTFSWKASSSATITGAPATGTTAINNTLINSGSISGTVTYAITPVSTGECPGTSKDFVVTVLPSPTIALSGAPGNRIALATATLDAGAGYASYQWTNSAGTVLGTTQKQLTSTPDVYQLKVSKTGVNGFGYASKQVSPEFSGLNENYIVANTPLVGNIKDENNIMPLTVDQLSQSVQYFDGLGRLTQTINTLGSPQKLDMVQLAVYDSFGREYRKYLPVSFGNNGWPKTGLLNAAGNYTINYYSNSSDKIADDVSPFSETVFEPSPLNRVLKQGSPGAVWQPVNPRGDIYSTADKTIKKRYLTNGENEVLLLSYDGATGLVRSPLAYFDANQLYATQTYDEHNNDVVEYTDKQGRVVCKKVYVEKLNNVNQYAFTYYVYDDFGNLVLVLSPEGVKALKNLGN